MSPCRTRPTGRDRVALIPVEGSAGRGIEEHPLAAGEAIHELLQRVEVLLGDEAVLPGIPEGDLAASLGSHQDLDREIGAGEHDAARLPGQVLGEQVRSRGRFRADGLRVPQPLASGRQRFAPGHDVRQRRLRVADLGGRPCRRHEQRRDAQRAPERDPPARGRDVEHGAAHEREPQGTEGQNRQADVRDDVVGAAVDDVRVERDPVAGHAGDADQQRPFLPHEIGPSRHGHGERGPAGQVGGSHRQAR